MNGGRASRCPYFSALLRIRHPVNGHMDLMDGGEDGSARRFHASHQIRQQQGNGDVIFWAAIVGIELVGPFSVSDGCKMTFKLYINFLKE